MFSKRKELTKYEASRAIELLKRKLEEKQNVETNGSDIDELLNGSSDDIDEIIL